MGRTTSKRQGTPGQQSSKHENGAVGPGKKLQKQKSNGLLNGHSKSAQADTSSTPPLPATLPQSNGQARHDPVADTPKMLNEALRRISVGGYDESSSGESYHNHPTISISHETHRRIDVNSAKNPAVHRDYNPFSLFTVLRSCPLWDTIAILIVLLQIPPTILTIVHLLFALLTFVPPSTAGHSFTITDIFEGAIGTPSLGTIVVIDLVVLVVWLFLWRPLQDISLDIAQSVIALTLGGGTSGRDAGYWNVCTCLGIIGLSHIVKTGGLKNTPGIRMLLPENSILLNSDLDDPLDFPLVQNNKGIQAGVRTLLAIHILTQGLVRYIRDWYVRRERRDSLSNANGDPEAAKWNIHSTENQTIETTHNHTHNTLSSNDDLSFTNGADKTLTAKKKRKASALVRIRQPLWSALASTKIVMAKEYETSRTAKESAGTNATDVNNLGNAPFSTEPDRIWITYIGFDEIYFNTSFFPTHSPTDSAEQNANTSGIDRSKPFYVRINNSPWALTRIHPTENEGQTERSWGGEIRGLAPMSSYECEFISTVDDSRVFSTNLKTKQGPTADASAPPLLSPSVQQSPTTTLRTSIAGLEVQRDEEVNKQKRVRKDQKSKTNTARRDIDKLSTGMSSAGGNDDRLRQKVQQSNLHAKQADEAVITLTTELEQIETLPEEEARHFKAAKSSYQYHKDTHKANRKDFEEDKNESTRRIAALNAEVTSFQQEKEKFQKRIKNQKEKFERITDANARGLDEAQRKETERIAKDSERTRTETSLLERVASLTPQIQSMQSELSAVWQNVQHMQQLSLQAYQAQFSQPQNPYENMSDHQSAGNNSTYTWNPTANFNPSAGYMSHGGGFDSQQSIRTRGRSSSMLSNVSGFTQSSSEDKEFMPNYLQQSYYDGLVQDHAVEQGISEGSSNASAEGSQSDPKSPVPGYRSGTIIGGSRYVNPWDETGGR